MGLWSWYSQEIASFLPSKYQNLLHDIPPDNLRNACYKTYRTSSSKNSRKILLKTLGNELPKIFPGIFDLCRKNRQ